MYNMLLLYVHVQTLAHYHILFELNDHLFDSCPFANGLILPEKFYRTIANQKH